MRWGLALGAAACAGRGSGDQLAMGGAAHGGAGPRRTQSTPRAWPSPVHGVRHAGGCRREHARTRPRGRESHREQRRGPADEKGPAGQRTSKTRVSVTGSGSRITLVSEVEVHEVRGNSRLNGRTLSP